MIQHVSTLVNLEALDRRRITRVPFHGGRQGLAAVQNVQPRFGEIEFRDSPGRRGIHPLQSRFPWLLDECPRSFSARPGLFPMRLPSAVPRTASHQLARRRAGVYPAGSPTVLQLRPARLDEMFADRAFSKPYASVNWRMVELHFDSPRTRDSHIVSENALSCLTVLQSAGKRRTLLVSICVRAKRAEDTFF
jgi:hypothetical protein